MGAIGYRLADLAGLTLAEYTARTERTNLLPAYPGVVWPSSRAKPAAERLAPALRGRRVILLGQHVARAFGWRRPFFVWVPQEEGGAIAAIPHPSSRNLWWNDPEHRAAARRFLRAAFGTEDET
jgi:hypothetical protein